MGGGNDIPMVSPEITNGKIREALITLSLTLTTHVNMCMEPRVNVV